MTHTRAFRALSGVALALAAAIAPAQAGLSGKGQYPQARTVSGLAGGGSAVRPNGSLGMNGAMALSTPIGYTLASGRAVLMGGATSADSQWRWFDGDVTVNGSNGTAAAMIGSKLGNVGFTVSLVQTSRLSEDRIINLQVSPFGPVGRASLSIGAQDLLDQTVTTPNFYESAQSFFAVATYDAGSGVFISAGHGTKRFGKGFASMSAPVMRRTRAMAEHDGYGWNYGLGLDLTDPSTDGVGQPTLFIGLCQGRYATWALSMRF